MAKEMVLSPVLVEIGNETMAKNTFHKLTEGAIGLGGIIYEDFKDVNGGYMITYAFPDEEKRDIWKALFRIQ